MALPPELKRRLRTVPPWWADAKLGIFVHWTPASVPAFAPTDADIGELVMSGAPDALASTPYSEWYENSLRFPDSPASRFHREHYGDRPYESFGDDFSAALDRWDPDAWAARFAATGARYVVLVTKHHDGFCLWPSDVPNPHRSGWRTTRDVVGELARAVRARGMRFGVYYSGGLDWTFEPWPIGTPADAVAAAPRGDYPGYAEAQVRELIERYRPSVLWNDISWPTDQRRLNRLLVDYYRSVPDGVVNDRWMAQLPIGGALRHPVVQAVVNRGATIVMKRAGGLVPPTPRFFQHRTPEYVTLPDISRTPWECVRGMDKGFAYNRTSVEADFLSRDELLRSLVDIVSKGGNLMLNVGPRGEDAQIPDEQLVRLGWLAEFAGVVTGVLAASRPWIRASDRSAEGHDVRYVALGDRLWALCWWDEPAPTGVVAEGAAGSPAGAVTPPATLTLPLLASPTTAVSAPGGVGLEFSGSAAGIRVTLGASGGTTGPFAVAFDRVSSAPV